MKYRPAQYAEALYGALEKASTEEQKRIVKRFAELLMRHRVTGKVRAIYETYEKFALRKQGIRSVRLETVYPASEKLKKEIHEILGKNIQIKEIINFDLLGGLKILVDDEILIDASAQRQMESLFMKKPPSVR